MIFGLFKAFDTGINNNIVLNASRQDTKIFCSRVTSKNLSFSRPGCHARRPAAWQQPLLKKKFL